MINHANGYVRGLLSPDWFIAAGTIKSMVWNQLHRYPVQSYQKDADVIYHDVLDIGGSKEKKF